MKFDSCCGLCDREAVTSIAGVKLCSVCKRLVAAIEADAHQGQFRAPLTTLPKGVAE